MLKITWLAGALLLTGCGAVAEPGPESREGGDPLRDWVVEETERLAGSTGVLGDSADRVAAELADVAAEAEAGRALHAASRLASPRQRIEARLYRMENRSAADSPEALAAAAAELDGELDRLEARLDAALPERPAALRALADSARVHARAYQGSAVAYGRAASLPSGLYYLGAARSLLGTASDLAALPVEAPEGGGSHAPSPAALEAELAELDRRTIEAYRAPGAEVDRHSDFIALNAEIKEARDLLAAGRTDGALLAVLEAHRRLEEILAEEGGDGAAPAPGPDELRRRAAGFRQRLDEAPWDASLGRLLVETAEDALAADDPGDGRLRRARALLLHVVPRYFELHRSSQETP